MSPLSGEVGDPVPPTAALTAEQRRVVAAELAALAAAGEGGAVRLSRSG